MNKHVLRNGAIVAVGTVAAAAALAGTGAASNGVSLTNVSAANDRSDGYAPASRLSPELRQIVTTQGSALVENPSAPTQTYGYNNDVVTSSGRPQMVPTKTSPNTEAQKTEPDKNTYLVFKNSLAGADSAYDYGTHFLFQGHEGGAGGNGYITRVNLDGDAEHRVTVLATKDSDGNAITTIDGSTWDPFAQRLLFTTESASHPTYAATPSYPSTVTDVSGALGRGGYEGIQDDSDGNVWVVEDIGGSAKTTTNSGSTSTTTAKRPNSYVYRYAPATPGDLSNGKLEALQVLGADGHPITFESQAALNNPDQVALHSYGQTFTTRWVTVHDKRRTGPLRSTRTRRQRAAQATPFKRPENGVFQPSDGFRDFFFTETGDTNATSPENGTAGGWGSLFRLRQSSPSASTGTISVFYSGDQAHTGLDNINFISAKQLGAVEDAGDTLHGQRDALDSGFSWDITRDYSQGAQPVRWLAEGRDASAAVDASFGGFGKNDGDNEITGLRTRSSTATTSPTRCCPPASDPRSRSCANGPCDRVAAGHSCMIGAFAGRGGGLTGGYRR